MPPIQIIACWKLSLSIPNDENLLNSVKQLFKDSAGNSAHLIQMFTARCLSEYFKPPLDNNVHICLQPGAPYIPLLAVSHLAPTIHEAQIAQEDPVSDRLTFGPYQHTRRA
ncbi:hypothetical protein BOTBODRAFT_513218 [Botryobasidium botryosum FD-172 SS1]|uniref:Uncharacterized protein n=1 Tax=Botryobasidium botryosum (strain FD-172 SS1) TaxID=930990 RepID=A0A067N404_BOTB1|nr:hypothetical protein BOTBODRAFT_513218 [Botryobasidium botryosum FD-172 SS1]